MEILLFGGAFDPPHIGHVLVIEQAIQQLHPDELWVIPSYGSTFGKHMSPVTDRVAMTESLVLSLKSKVLSQKVKVSTVEIDNQLSGSTYELYQYLNNHASCIMHYSFLIGSDQLQSFTQWVKWEELLEAMQFYVYIRQGYPVNQDHIGGGLLPGMKLLAGPEISDVSSTMIRQRLQHDESITGLVPATVATYIQENGLYR